MSIKNYDQLFDSEGKYITDSRYQEIHVLDKMLTKASIPHTMGSHLWTDFKFVIRLNPRLIE